MNFYKHFVGDYQRSTAHLSIVEHGAYRLMLDQFYGTGKPLPVEKKALYRLLRAESGAEKKAIDAVSLQFWRQIPADFHTIFGWLNLNTEEERQPLCSIATEWSEPDGLINVRALRELVDASVRAMKNRKIAIQREANKAELRRLEAEAAARKGGMK
jgi:uncharacterized protein YdaU (DUF1376 family)